MLKRRNVKIKNNDDNSVTNAIKNIQQKDKSKSSTFEMIELPFVYDDFSTNDDTKIVKNQKEKDIENATIVNQLTSTFNLTRRYKRLLKKHSL